MHKEQHESAYTLKQSVGILFRMWNYCRQYRFRFYAGFIIGSLSPLFFAYMDSYIMKSFSEVCVDGSYSTLISTIIRIVVIELIGFTVFPIAFGTIYTTYSKISGVIKKDMFEKAQNLPVSYIEGTYSGDLVNRLTSDFDSAIQLVAYPGVGQYNPFALMFMMVAIGVFAGIRLNKDGICNRPPPPTAASIMPAKKASTHIKIKSLMGRLAYLLEPPVPRFCTALKVPRSIKRWVNSASLRGMPSSQNTRLSISCTGVVVLKLLPTSRHGAFLLSNQRLL